MGTLVRELTKDLRSSPGPLWARLRQLLRARSVEPDETVVADLFEDDADVLFGVLITPAGKVIRFVVTGAEAGAEDAQITEWVDLTNKWQSSPYKREVSEALELHQRAV